jgi:hypothetical protein
MKSHDHLVSPGGVHDFPFRLVENPDKPPHRAHGAYGRLAAEREATMFRHSIVAVAFTLIVVACARAQGPQSPDGRYRVESARSGESVHCRVIEEATGRVVLTTHAQFPSKNDVKSNDLQSCGAFSSDSTRIAAIYHYGHRGSYTWIGVFSLATGKLVRAGDLRMDQIRA